MEKINIANLLKDCPKDMELDCTMYEDVYFDYVDELNIIHCYIKNEGFKTSITFNQHGTPNSNIKSKCVIFPKGKNTWEGFVPPCKFKDGDILVHTQNQRFVMSIYHKGITERTIKTHCILWDKNEGLSANMNICCYPGNTRLATEEEKQKLFDALKDNGYKWNAETKTLEELIIPKFHEGQWLCANKPNDYAHLLKIIKVVDVFGKERYKVSRDYDSDLDVVEYNFIEKNYHLWTIQDAKDGDVLCTYECSEPKIVFILKGTPKKYYALSYHCYYNIMYPHFASDSEKGCLAPNDEDVKPATKEQREILLQKMKEAGYKWNPETKTLEKLIEPKFKVGDKIKSKVLKSGINIITKVCENHYELDDGCTLSLNCQDEWEIVPGKFDISTLIPFESRVLIRDNKLQKWYPAIWGVYDPETYFPYKLIGCISHCCIPYEGNEHLLNTTNDCDEFYKTWE